MRRIEFAALIAVVGLAVGCDSGTDPHAGHDHSGHQDASSEDAHGHSHAAPRGGALVVLGEEHAHVEIVVEPHDGRIDLFALSAHADAPVRLPADGIDVELTVDNKPAETFRLLPVASNLTGEKVGNTSQFGLTDERIFRSTKLTGRISTLTIRGATFTDITFAWPP